MNENELFCVNDVFMNLSNQVRYRLLWISTDGTECWWISLDTSKRTPDRTSLDELRQMMRTGRIVRVEDPVHLIPSPSDKQKECRDRKYGIIEYAVKQEPQIYHPHERAEILAETAERTGTKAHNLYKLIGPYWKNGKSPDALLTHEDKRGKCRDYTNGNYKSFGRKRRKGAPGKVLTPEDFRYFSQALRKYYMVPNKLTLQATYDKMIQIYYCDVTETDDGERKVTMRPNEELPSFMQFRYWYRKNRDIIAQTKAREGEGDFERNCRGITGVTERIYNYPGAAFQIDATIADIYLVSENDRNAIVGRPVMYFVKDAYTRMVTGMYITFRYPSWADAAAALDNAFTDKVEYCSRYGISITPEEWPCRQLPEALIADRGEMEGRVADVLVSGLGIRIENTPPYRGDLKGIIEQHFCLINLEMSDLLPGKVKKDFGQRGSRDYRLDAKLDIRQFTRIIIKCVLFHNNAHWMKEYRRETQMEQMGIRPIPLDLWEFGIRYRSGGLMSASRDKVRYTLLPKEEASLTEKGIAFHGMFYTCDEALEEEWFARARIMGRTKLNVAYDPASMAHIYLMRDDGRFMQCARIDKEGREGDVTLAEAEDVHQKELDAQAAHSHEELEKKAELGDFIDQEVKTAKKMAEGQPKISKTERIAAIGRNRQEAIRKEKGLTDGINTLQTDAVPVKQEESQELNAVEKMIREQLDERLKRMRD